MIKGFRGQISVKRNIKLDFIFDSKNTEYANVDSAFSRRVIVICTHQLGWGHRNFFSGCIQRNAELGDGSAHWEEAHTAGGCIP